MTAGPDDNERDVYTGPGCAPVLGSTVLALWLPTLLPFLFGPLTESSHAVRWYLIYLPIQPGMLASTLLGLVDLAFILASAAFTLAVVAVVAMLIAAVGRLWPLVVILIALLSGAQAFGVAQLMRA